MNREIVMIYARAANGAIGREGALPWHLPADLNRFKALTMGLPMVMGRKTFESLPGLLPGRQHIVLTRSSQWSAKGACIAVNAEQALKLAGPGKIAIIGGAEIYRLFQPIATRLEITQIHANYEGDAFMAPAGAEWVETERHDHPASEHYPAFSFLSYIRRNAA